MGTKLTIILGMALILLVSSCSSSGDDTTKDVNSPLFDNGFTDNLVDLGPAVVCSELGEEACKANSDCEAIEGWPQPDACLVWADQSGAGPAQFVSCKDFSPCTAMFKWVHPDDSPEDIWIFPSCTPEGWKRLVLDEDPCGPACPAVHPWLAEGQSLDCDLPEGTVCSWPAEGCPEGQKPDNACTCEMQGNRLRFECERPFYNCLPFEGADIPDGSLTRPAPQHREVAEACTSTFEPRPEPSCTAIQPSMHTPDECTDDTDCEGEGARCLDQWQGMGDTACTCHTSTCQEDIDCTGADVCSCGVTENTGTYCGGPGGDLCLNQCLSSDCRTDADCGPGKVCSPSSDHCGWQTVGYHCHDADIDKCLTDWDCMGNEWACIFVEDQEGWGCVLRPMCD
jgi:hypothetical protein